METLSPNSSSETNSSLHVHFYRHLLSTSLGQGSPKVVKAQNTNNLYLFINVHRLVRNIPNQEFYYKVKYSSGDTQGVLSPVGLPGIGDAQPEY